MFTSSVNVCFDGHPIINGNEDDHKWLDCKCSDYNNQDICSSHHLDAYSKSKQDAEQIVLSYSSHQPNETSRNGKNICQEKNTDFKRLRACVLRYVILLTLFYPGVLYSLNVNSFHFTTIRV